MPELLTISEVAAVLKVRPITVWKWVKSGRLPAYRLGRLYRIPKDAVLSLLKPVTPA